MVKLVSWRPKALAAVDIPNWKDGKFTYTREGRDSRKAFWVFDLEGEYRPSMASADHLLIRILFGSEADRFIADPQNHIDFEATGSKDETLKEWNRLKVTYNGENIGLNGQETLFAGEAKHPYKVIVKNNEKGGYGIGAVVRTMFPVKVRIANNDEYCEALGVGKKTGLDKKWALDPKYKF